MSFVNRKHRRIIYIIFFSLCFNNCQLNSPKKNHGINFLENREKALVLGKTNQNDVISIIGNPHTVSIKEDNTWIYFERTITRGKLIKLGQNVLSENNILKLKFNKYGVLTYKKILHKDDMKKIKYSKKETSNERVQKSFVESFLSSVKQKMYRKRSTKF
jgi:outer membrane protein assembly factor BamE (lipoprotein component of BamABCDE complex)